MPALRSKYVRRLSLLTVLAVILRVATGDAALVDRAELKDAGLMRAWTAQAPIDNYRGGGVTAIVHRGVVYALTTRGQLRAFDGETGATLWTNRVGDPRRRSLGPAISDTRDGVRVCLTNGSNVYKIDANTGAVLKVVSTPGAPGAPPAIAGKRMFVPLVDGRVIGAPLTEETLISWNYKSVGEIFASPVPVKDSVLWTTSQGFLYAASADGSVRYRFRGAAPLVGPPAVDEVAYLPTTTGLLYAIDPENGRQLWRASVGDDVQMPAVVAAGVAYVGSTAPALHAYDAADGRPLWSIDGVNQFVSSSGDRVYAVGPDGRLAMVNIASEGGEARWISRLNARAITNTESDRLYLVSDSGLIQCLHEESLTSARRHDGAPAPQADNDAKNETTEEPRESDPFEDDADEQPIDDDPFADEPNDAEDDPFATDDSIDEPEDDGFGDFGADEDDPFADPF
ncbi:MAG: PQQ-binding-like beta-propeller repeat protein [Planctomycetota bacterium]